MPLTDDDVDVMVELPAFALDCRDWIVLDAPEPEAADDAPVLAVLSTVVLGDGIDGMQEAVGSLTLGVLPAGDDLADLAPRPVAPDSVAQEVLEHDPVPGTRRYVLPAPTSADRPRLALLAEFTVPTDAAAELDRRVAALMSSFRWQAA